MAHFAKLDENNVVTEVIVVNNDVIENLPFPDSEPLGVAFCQSLYGIDTVWKQTSYNSSFRLTYAGIGSTYDVVKDIFIPKKPWDGCVWNTTTLKWSCPPLPLPAMSPIANG
jgi:hypothetical protein